MVKLGGPDASRGLLIMRRHTRRMYRSEPTAQEVGRWRDLATQARIVAGAPTMAAGVLAKAHGRTRGKPLPKVFQHVGSALHRLWELTGQWPGLTPEQRAERAPDLAELAGQVLAILDIETNHTRERRSRADTEG